jgi:hypothetical protein
LRGPPPERGTRFVVLDTAHRQRFAHNEDLLRTHEEPFVRSWLARGDHDFIAMDMLQPTADFMLLERGHDPRAGWSRRYFRSPPPQASAPPNHGTWLTDCLVVERATRIDRQLRLDLRADQPCAPDLALRIGTDPKPRRVDLLFDGVLSPAQLRAGDRLTSTHILSETEAASIGQTGRWLGAVRSSGARPHPTDPIARRVPLTIAP